MAQSLTPTDAYPYLLSVRGTEPVLARRDGSYYWLTHQRCLGIVWHPCDVQVLATHGGAEPIEWPRRPKRR